MLKLIHGLAILLALGVWLFGKWVDDSYRIGGLPPRSYDEVLEEDFATSRAVLKKYCLTCHSTKAKKGSLDLERFATLDDLRKDLKVWQHVIEQVEAGQMPPEERPQPSAAEKKELLAWVRGFLDAEARARAGDPGFVPLRRLSNAEYDHTIRDLTGVDLRPTREFPADGAAGEGFTNAAEALTDISPALFTKYLNAAKDIAAHAILLPDGIRFSQTKTRRDWTDESLAKLRAVFAKYTAFDGKLAVQPYIAATIRHREALAAGKVAEVAAKEKLNAKYLGILWETLTDRTPSHPLDAIRAKWRTATEKDVPAIVAEITAWQTALWKFVPVGSYRYGNMIRQIANDPKAADRQEVRLAVKPAPGQNEVVVYLVAQDAGGKSGGIEWLRPRFEGQGKPPLLLKDYDKFSAALEVDYPSVFANSAKYLAAAIDAANNPKGPLEDLSSRYGIDAAFLRRWVETLAVESFGKDREKLGREVPLTALTLMSDKLPIDPQQPAINGWHKKGTDLPVLVTNSSEKLEQIPGKVPPHGVAVHPMPKEFVAVVWKSPIAGSVRVEAQIAHAHPACGNGVAWWLEHRRGNRAAVFGEGSVDLGGEAKPGAKTLKVQKGDSIILAVDAKNADHVCDMTDIALTITETAKDGRVWNLGADVADDVLAANPHADKLGNKETWSFVFGPSRPLGKGLASIIPPGSLLGKWRDAAADPKRQEEAAKLAAQVQKLLSGPRPKDQKSPDRILYDSLVSVESMLFQGIDASRLGKRMAGKFGLDSSRFGKGPDGKSIDAASFFAKDGVTEIRLPAALLSGREFVVEGKLDGADERMVIVQARTTPLAAQERWDGKSPILATANSAGYKKLVAGHDAFRRVFPTFLCFPRILPDDEVVCLKMYHREDEPLARLFLSADEKKYLDRLWVEHRFITRQPVAENAYLPQFIGFVTQDQPKELLAYFESQRPVFKERADEFLKEEEAAIPRQLDALLDFAEKAVRRPLQEKEKADYLSLYRTIRGKGASHDEAFRGVLERVLVSPAFLFRIENAPAGTKPGPVNDWELGTRLSYFLWSSVPDEELRKLAVAGKLRDQKVLAAQVERMLGDDRTRALAIEFGTQWIHVRGFDELKEKNEKLFPTFTPELRKAIYEESILFFQDLFRSDRPVTAILDADYTFLNETLAKHYGIPGVSGKEWRRVERVRKYGRGGILGLASVQTKEAGASRTSPVLRGNWVVETLLGEKLPNPPPNVPQLPEMEGAEKLTTRQLVEKHVSVQSCAVCHVRIDPFGFSLEHYDPIGRHRDREITGLPIDAKSKLKDGTEFEGIDGLRNYLLTRKKDVIVRLFCKRLLGYALGRAVSLSDTGLLDEMVAELNKHNGRISTAVQVIVRSPQFRMVRGSEFGE